MDLTADGINAIPSINRTSMELKFAGSNLTISGGNTINRTSMELKYIDYQINWADIVSINRTSMELK